VGCPTFSEQGPLKRKTLVMRVTLSLLRATEPVFANYFIPSFYELLHNKLQIVTAGCMFCSVSINKIFKRCFFRYNFLYMVGK